MSQITTSTEAEQTVREAWLNGFMDRARPVFERAGYPLPLNTRVSVSFTSHGLKAKRIAECFSPEASTDGHYEIFVSPLIQNQVDVCAAFTHELVHAADGMKSGHGKGFKAIATALGLQGQMTATTAGDGWFAWANDIMAELGPMPYAALRPDMTPPQKPSTTYLMKAECPDCGWLSQVTRKHVAPHSHLNCPVPDCEGVLDVTDKRAAAE